MSTQPTRRQEDIGTERKRPSLRDVRAKNQVGTDAAGREHYWDSVRQCVWVVADDAIVYRQPLRHRSLEDWVSHIETERGWETLFYTPGSVFDRLAEVFRG